jgi:hypothetical protein
MPVTAHTAHTLKQSNFPQPDPTFGQVWYTPTGEPRVFCCRTVSHDVHRTPLWRFVTEWGRQDDVEPGVVRRDWCYGATAGDVLRELGVLYDLCCNHRDNLFLVSDDNRCRAFHESEHEAAARAWLSQQPTPTP